MDRETKESLDEAEKLEMQCGCDEPPTFDATRDGWNKAKRHQRNHNDPDRTAISFVYPED